MKRAIAILFFFACAPTHAQTIGAGPFSPTQVLTAFVTSCFSQAKQGIAFNCVVGATGGLGGYTFSKVSGAFPAGIADVTSTGLVSGTTGLWRVAW